jgi:hypothetical protein
VAPCLISSACASVPSTGSSLFRVKFMHRSHNAAKILDNEMLVLHGGAVALGARHSV